MLAELHLGFVLFKGHDNESQFCRIMQVRDSHSADGGVVSQDKTLVTFDYLLQVLGVPPKERLLISPQQHKYFGKYILRKNPKRVQKHCVDKSGS